MANFMEVKMPKNIVICSDGTGNTANKDRGTNVFKLFEAVDLGTRKFRSPQDKSKIIVKQVTIYDDGVGSQNFLLFKILGGAFGWGLKRNVKQLYRELARVYRAGDNIYVFGFSRGAFTVRTLIGFIAECGIPKNSVFRSKTELNALIDAAYKHYQRNYRSWLSRFCFPQWLDDCLPQKLVDTLPDFIANRLPIGDRYEPNYYHLTPPIKFVGVWDTVSAVGLPFQWATDFWNKFIYRFSFKNNNLYAGVEKACQAVSIDDERQSFHPMMWNENRSDYNAKEKNGALKKDENGNPIPLKSDEDWENEWIEQVWFPGVHSNVGGGYPKHGMSLVVLHWMMVRAYRAGLLFLDHDWDFIRDHGNISDTLYKSRAGVAVYYRYLPRNIFELCRKNNITCKVHESFHERISQGTDGYSPGNLPPSFLLVNNEPGQHDNYRFSQHLFNGADPNKETSLWKSLQTFIFLRRQSYYLFLATTFLGTGLYLKELCNAANKKFEGTPAQSCWQYLGEVFESFKTTDFLLSFGCNYLWIGMVIAFFASWYFRVGLLKKRIKFWHPHRS